MADVDILRAPEWREVTLGEVVPHADVVDLHPNVMLLPITRVTGFPTGAARVARDVRATPVRGDLDRYLVVYVPGDA